MTERSLRGRRLLLTGGARGIGLAIAERLHREGAKLALLVRDPVAATAVLSFAPEALIVGDLRDTGRLEAAVESAHEALSGLDGLVQCAGVVAYEDLLSVSHESLALQLQVNFVAPFLLASAAAKKMGASGTAGDLLFVGSTLGVRPAPLTAAYSASKAALISLMRSCTLELGANGIRANAILPGVIDTDMVNVLRPGSDVPAQEVPLALTAQRQALADLHLLKRLGSAEEVAEAAAYLLRSDFVNGSLLTIDGGISLGA